MRERYKSESNMPSIRIFCMMIEMQAVNTKMFTVYLLSYSSICGRGLYLAG